MTVALDHVLVPASDKERSARFLASLLDLEVGHGSTTGAPVFAVVRVGKVKLDFGDSPDVAPQHYAFAVDDEEFDAVLARIEQAGLEVSADPRHRQPGELNDYNGGRGLYVHDPDGHNLEFLTVP